MEIAIACNGLLVSPTVEQATGFTVYRVEKGIIIGCRYLPKSLALGSTQDVASFFASLSFDAIIAGSIDPISAKRFEGLGIEALSNGPGNVQDAIRNFISTTLMDGELLSGWSSDPYSNDPYDLNEDAFESEFEGIFKRLLAEEG